MESINSIFYMNLKWFIEISTFKKVQVFMLQFNINIDTYE